MNQRKPLCCNRTNIPRFLVCQPQRSICRVHNHERYPTYCYPSAIFCRNILVGSNSHQNNLNYSSLNALKNQNCNKDFSSKSCSDLNLYITDRIIPNVCKKKTGEISDLNQSFDNTSEDNSYPNIVSFDKTNHAKQNEVEMKLPVNVDNSKGFTNDQCLLSQLETLKKDKAKEYIEPSSYNLFNPSDVSKGQMYQLESSQIQNIKKDVTTEYIEPSSGNILSSSNLNKGLESSGQWKTKEEINTYQASNDSPSYGIFSHSNLFKVSLSRLESSGQSKTNEKVDICHAPISQPVDYSAKESIIAYYKDRGSLSRQESTTERSAKKSVEYKEHFDWAKLELPNNSVVMMDASTVNNESFHTPLCQRSSSEDTCHVGNIKDMTVDNVPVSKASESVKGPADITQPIEQKSAEILKSTKLFHSGKINDPEDAVDALEFSFIDDSDEIYD